jgi:uncharacterized iron-regulated protein
VAPAPSASAPSASAPWPAQREDAPPPPALRAAFDGPRPIDFLLLGEIHDHPLHHGLRARWLEALAERHRFVLALEQLDADRQPALEAALAASTRRPGTGAAGEAARRLVQAAGFDFRGWHWPFYAPYVELALRRGLPLAAANLSNAQARRIARGEPHPLAGVEPAGWGAADREAMAVEIRDGHCGMLPERSIAPMAAAQLARDAQIARALVEARRVHGLPVVLIAGNGHVRSDLGVPRHLQELAPGARVLAVGFVEAGRPAGAFDLEVRTPVHDRPDPCEGLRRR